MTLQIVRPATAMLIAGMTPALASAQGLVLTGDVTATTDYVFRGVSQTMSQPALQASFGLAYDNGLSAYLWGSNIDYVADGDPDDGARLEIDAVLQYDVSLTERIAATVGRAQYFVPGINPGLQYDYGEWWTGLTLDARHRVAVYQSDSIFGSGESAWYVVAGTVFELPAGLSLDVEVGYTDLRKAWGAAYSHVGVELSGDMQAFTWQAALHATGAGATRLFDDSVVEPRAVLSVSWAVW